MKTILFTAFLFLQVLILCAQPYHPLISENTYWDVLHGDASICYYGSGSRYFFSGDTVISGVQYKKLQSYKLTNLNPGPFCAPFGVLHDPVLDEGFMREDTTTRKVYLYNQGGVEMRLFIISPRALQQGIPFTTYWVVIL